MVKCPKCDNENDDKALRCSKCSTSLLPGFLTGRERLELLGKSLGVLIGGGLMGFFCINLMSLGAWAYGTEPKETPGFLRIFGFLILIGAASAAFTIGKKAFKSISVGQGYLQRSAKFGEEGNYSQAVTDAILAIESDGDAKKITDLYIGAAIIYSVIRENASSQDLVRLKQPLDEKFSQLFRESTDESIRQKAAIALAGIGSAAAAIQLLEEATTAIKSGKDIRKNAQFPLLMSDDLSELSDFISRAEFIRVSELVVSALTSMQQSKNREVREAAKAALDKLSREEKCKETAESEEPPIISNKLGKDMEASVYDPNDALLITYQHLPEDLKSHLSKGDVKLILEAKSQYVERMIDSGKPPIMNDKAVASIMKEAIKRGRNFKNEDIDRVLEAEEVYLKQIGAIEE